MVLTLFGKCHTVRTNLFYLFWLDLFNSASATVTNVFQLHHKNDNCKKINFFHSYQMIDVRLNDSSTIVFDKHCTQKQLRHSQIQFRIVADISNKSVSLQSSWSNYIELLSATFTAWMWFDYFLHFWIPINNKAKTIAAQQQTIKFFFIFVDQCCVPNSIFDFSWCRLQQHIKTKNWIKCLCVLQSGAVRKWRKVKTTKQTRKNNRIKAETSPVPNKLLVVGLLMLNTCLRSQS